MASAHDMGVKPLLCHATDHYARAYCLLVRGQGKANESVSELGYIAYCPSCHHREVIRGLTGHLEARCPSCGSDIMVSGPLWIGEIFDCEFCRSVADELPNAPWVSRRAWKLLKLINDEAGGPPTYYSLPRLCDDLGLRMPPIGELVEALRERGWWASRTHFDPQGVRTEASASEVVEVIRELTSGA